MTQDTATISRTVAALEKALAYAFEQQDCEVEHDRGSVTAKCYVNLPGVEGFVALVRIDVSRLAIDVERELA